MARLYGTPPIETVTYPRHGSLVGSVGLVLTGLVHIPLDVAARSSPAAVGSNCPSGKANCAFEIRSPPPIFALTVLLEIGPLPYWLDASARTVSVVATPAWLTAGTASAVAA